MGAVPDSKWTTHKLIECDDIVVCHNRWSGTYGGTSFRGITTPAGNRFAVDHIHIYRVVDGRIAEHWVARDDLGMLMQIGADIAGRRARRELGQRLAATRRSRASPSTTHL